jgi:hypothetical protein
MRSSKIGLVGFEGQQESATSARPTGEHTRPHPQVRKSPDM